MIKRITKKILSKYLGDERTEKVVKAARRFAGMALKPVSGRPVRAVLSARSASLFRKKDYQGLKSVNTALNLFEREKGLTSLRSMPCIAHINLTSHCNLRCVMCFQAHSTKMEREHMGAETLDMLSEEIFPYLKTIKMDASGEALLYPGFQRVLDLCGKYQNELEITTNGTRLSEKLTETLVGFRGLKHFCVSFDAITAEVFEWIRANARFDDVKGNFENFCKRRRDQGRDDITVGISFTAMRRNIDQLPAMVEFAARWGIDVIYVAYAFIAGSSEPSWSLYYDQDRANRAFDEAENLGRKLGVGVSLPLRFGQKSDTKWRDCSWAWNSVYIHPSGVVGPCCIIQFFTQTDDYRHLTDKRVHSLETKNFREIWNGESFKKLRETVNTPEAVYTHCRDMCPVFGRGSTVEIHRHFDPALYPDSASAAPSSGT